jgi:hypothetical protein
LDVAEPQCLTDNESEQEDSMKAEARDERDAPPEKEAVEDEGSSAQQAAERAQEMEESGEENVS